MIMEIFTHINNQGHVKPPKISKAGALLLEITNKQEALRTYNKAAITLVKTMVRPTETHYLGCNASIPAQG